MATGATVQTTTTVLATKESCGARGHARAIDDKHNNGRGCDKTDEKIMKIEKNS